VSLKSPVRRLSESPLSGLRTNASHTDETVYRLGSVSKLLFLYTFLVEVGHAHWHRPITDFIPELAEAAESCSAELDPLTCPDWHEITLGALASHLAGLGRGGPFAPAPTAIGGVPVTDLGLPPQPPVDIKQCESQPCTRAEEIRMFLQEAPLEAAFSVPIYSNGGYQILAYALEAITNRTMSDMISNDVFCPLQMGDSSYVLENGTAGVVPGSVATSGWNMPLGDAGPAGGMYSSPRDMVKLGQSILSNTQLSPAATRRWLKPWASTSVWQQVVGLAWEIARWPVKGRVVDVYTKQGDLGMFTFSATYLEWVNPTANNAHRRLPFPLRHYPGLQRRRRSPIRRQWWPRRASGALRDRPCRPTTRSRRNRTIPGRKEPRRNLHRIVLRRQHHHHIRHRAFAPRPQSHRLHLQLFRCS
jgi:CubicO group peptidase (beta-lactamase class C family)